MAQVLRSSPFGQVSGKIGEAVGVKHRGRLLVRSLPIVTNKKVSDHQLVNRAVFKAVHTFLAEVPTYVIRLGFQLQRYSALSAINEATSYHMLNAVELTEQGWVVKFDKLKFSKPIHRTARGWKSAATEVELGIKVSWEHNPFADKTTLPDDEAIIIIYDPKLEIFRDLKWFYQKQQIENVKRADLGFHIPVIRHFAGSEIDIWLFFVSADRKRVSDTQYLGVVKMPEL